MKQNMRERYIRNIKKVAGSALNQFQKYIEKYEEMKYFTGVLKRVFVDLEETSVKYIGSYCIMIPDELIYGFGYQPLRLCASHATAALIGEDVVPRDACPVVKASVGFHYMNVMPIYKQCKCAVIPMTCDAKRKSAEIMSHYLPVIPMPFYAHKSNDTFEQTVYDLHGLIQSMEKILGIRFSDQKMIEAYQDIQYAQQQIYALSQFMKADEPPITGSSFMMILNSFCFTNPREWGEHVAKLNQEIACHKQVEEERRSRRPRVYIAGSPISFPNYKIPFLVEELGGVLAGDESCMAGRLLYDPVIPADLSRISMIRALAARYTAACTCPVFDAVEDREMNLLEKIHTTRAEGIIYHVLRGCTPYDFELSFLEKMAETNDIPIIRIETDFSAEDVEQVKIRIEAFLELIERRR